MPLELVIRRLLLWRSSRGRVLLIDRVPGAPLQRQGFLPTLYRLILPRPDMVVLLTGDPELIAARKPDETTPDRTAREFSKWRSVAKRLGARQIVEVDTTKNDIETCCNQVVDAIIQNGTVLGRLYATPQEDKGSK